MKKNLLKYLFITMFAICVSFIGINELKAATVTIDINRDPKDKVFWIQNPISISPYTTYEIYFNDDDKYGGAKAAEDACNNVCTKTCTTHLNGSRGCKVSNLKSAVLVNFGKNYPAKLSYDDTKINSTDTKRVTTNCFMTNYQDLVNDNEVWGCKDRDQCVYGCIGVCAPGVIKAKDSEGNVTSKGEAYFCINNQVQPNLFVDVNGELKAWNTVQKTAAEAIAVTGEKDTLFGTDEWRNIPALLDGVANIQNGGIDCDDEGIAAVMKFAQKIFSFMRIGAVVLLILLSTIDFMGVVSSDDSNIMKKATQRFVKRAIFTVALMLLPSLINLIFAIVTVQEGMCFIS